MALPYKLTDFILSKPPYNSKAHGRIKGQWIDLGYTINYTSLAGESFMECGEVQASCGEYSGFTADP